MALTCNIDARGRRVRGIAGAILLLFGAGLLTISWPGAWWDWLIGVVCVLGGAFAIFESKAGWCALRALGVRTPF